LIWTREEDDVILRFVRQAGHKWNVLATQLPLRTEHAIRNRYHRLQSIALDADGLKAADTSA